MESSLERFSAAVQTFCTYGIYGVVVIFGSLGLINSLDTEIFQSINLIYIMFMAIVLVMTRGRLISDFRTKPLKAARFLAIAYLATFVNQWAFVNLEAYFSICLFAIGLVLLPYVLRLAVAVDRYRLGAKA